MDAAVALSVIIALVSVAVFAAPYFRYRIHLGDDALVTLHRFSAFAECLKEGGWPCWWIHHDAFGLGSPTHLFYPTVALWPAFALHVFGVSLVRAIELAAVANHLALGLVTWLVVRRRFSDVVALACATLVSLAPPHLLLLNQRSAYAEAWSLIAMVWAVSSWLDVTQPRQRARAGQAEDRSCVAVSWLALGLACTIMAHPLMMLLFAVPFAGLHLALWRSSAKHMRALTCAYLAALALSAHAWVPAVSEAAQLQTAALLTQGKYAYADHFYTSLWPLVAPARGAWPVRLGVLATVAVLLSVLFPSLKRQGAAREIAHDAPRAPGDGRGLKPDARAALAGMSLVACLLATSFTQPIWTLLPPLRLAQFPWRYLTVALAFAVLPLAWMLDRLGQRVGGAASMRASLVFAGLVAAVMLWGAPALKVVRGRDYDDARLLSAKARCGSQYHGGMDYLARGVDAQRLEQAQQHRCDIPVAEVLGVAEGAVVSAHRSSQGIHARVRLREEALVRFGSMAFPGWQIRLRNAKEVLPIDTAADDPFGQLRVRLPRGTHEVDAHFGWTFTRALAYAGSGLAWLVLFGTQMWPWLRRRRASRTD